MERSVIGVYEVNIGGEDFGYVRFPVCTDQSFAETSWLLEKILCMFGYMRYGGPRCNLSPMLEGNGWHFELIDTYEEYTE